MYWTIYKKKKIETWFSEIIYYHQFKPGNWKMNKRTLGLGDFYEPVESVRSFFWIINNSHKSIIVLQCYLLMRKAK